MSPAGGILLRVSGSGRTDLEIRIPPVNEALAHALPQAEAAYRNLSGDPALREAVREFGRSKA